MISIPTMSIVVGALAVAGGYLLFKLFQGLGWLLGYLFRGIGLFLAHVFRFVRNTLVDTIHCVGALLTAIAILPLILINLLIGRWPAAGHYGRATEDELVSSLLSLYRVGLGNPLRLLGLRPLVEGFERRIPDLVDRAPSRGRRGRRAGRTDFAGYQVVGHLPTGGSGAQLFLARPRAETVARFRDAGALLPGKVVIKSFDLETGSTLPQIVRESRALEAAKRMGLVLDHDLAEDRFHYVMPYVKGEELDGVVQRLHLHSGPEGLDGRDLALAVSYAQDLLHSLERFHKGGLWHKDVKPANVIVAGDRAHLVDFGLVTPLESALTLTTHGTEYYRDPEMVRLAMQGVKVHEVDGVKFDIYSAGALLYTMVENSFPAHGSLSKITKRCPEALQWIIRRAMADMGQRYRSADEMLGDLATLAAQASPNDLRPADLPSFGHADEPEPRKDSAHSDAMIAAAAAAQVETPPPLPNTLAVRRKPELDVRRRRRRGGLKVVAMMGISFACFATIVGSIRDSNSHHGGPRLAAAHEGSRFGNPRIRPNPERFSRLDEEDQRALELAEDLSGSYADQELTDIATQWRDQLDPLLPRGDASEESEQPFGRVLVLKDLSTTEAGAPLLAALGKALTESGFAVVGRGAAASEVDYRQPLDEAASEERDVDLMAAARNAVGLHGPADGEALLQLQDFLDGCPDLDAIVWIGPSGEEDGTHVYRLLIRRDLTIAPPSKIALRGSAKSDG